MDRVRRFEESTKGCEEMKQKHYGVYRGDEFLFTGTANECANRMSISESTVYFYTTPSYKNRARSSDNRIHVVKFNYDEVSDE